MSVRSADVPGLSPRPESLHDDGRTMSPPPGSALPVPPQAGHDPSSPAADLGARDRRRLRLWWTLLSVLLIGALAAWMMAGAAGARAEAHERQVAAFEEATGIRIVRVVVTAGGGVVELHYRVLDPDKAIAVHDDELPPGLIDEQSGAVVAVPFHDHAFRELHTGVLYRQMFMNGGGILEPGDLVTITVSDAVLEHIDVG